MSLVARRAHPALGGVRGRAVEHPQAQMTTEAAAAKLMGVRVRGVKKQKQAGDQTPFLTVPSKVN